MSATVSSADLPEWLVSVVPLEVAGSGAAGVVDEHSLDGFVARIANDGRRVATFLIDPSRRKKELDAALAFGVQLILRREGRLDLHAAAVAPGPGAGGLLIIGAKGAGKSSLTVALALSGWTFFSDDHVLVWREDEGLLVAGLRVPLFLTPDAAERLPTRLPRGQHVPSLGKRMFQPGELFPGQHATKGRIATVIFPERSSLIPSTLTRLTPMDCFQRLLATAPFLVSDPSSRPCLEVARAIADLPAFVLNSGPDLLDPVTADRVLRGAILERA